MNTRIIVGLLLLLIGSRVGVAAEVGWTGAGHDHNWDHAVNWTSNPSLPTQGTGSSGDTVLIDNLADYAVYGTAQATRYYQMVRVGYHADGRLDVTGGLLVGDDTIDFDVGQGGHYGEVNVGGGEFRPSAAIARIGSGAGSSGTINVTGGTMTFGRESSGISGYLGDSGGLGTVNVSGGTFQTRAGIILGNSGGTGVFNVQGSGVAKVGIGSFGTVDGTWIQNAGSTLKTGIDSGGVAPVDVVDNGGGGGNVTFNNGALLEPYFVAGFSDTNKWTVMTWDGTVTDNGLKLSPNVTDLRWDFYITNNALVVTYGFRDPYQPADLVASATNADEITLDWTAVSNATSYAIKRSLVSGGPYTAIGTSTVNHYVDSGLKSRTEYFYTVSAVVDGTSSSGSDEASAITLGFVHPGGLFTQSDLDRMRDQIQAHIDPWYASFQELKTYSRASYNYTVQGDPSFTAVARGGINGSAFQSDADAAYCNALMWAITQDTRHADKCVEIFNAWKNLTSVSGTGTYSLDAGLFAWKMVEAAEIIKSTYSGWNASDIQAFKDMLVYPGYSDTAVPASVDSTNGTFYWRIYMGDSGRHANQDAIAWRAMIIMGVFLDNEKMYERALRYFTGEPGRTDDIPLPTGPSLNGSLISTNEYYDYYNQDGPYSTTPNYGYNGALTNMFWQNGQCQESSRDQAHTVFDLAIASGIAEVAWNQGDASVWTGFDNRLLEGFEYTAKYNTSYLQTFPDQPTPWEPTGTNFIQRFDRTGRWYSKKINPYKESSFTSSDITRGEFPGKRPVFEQAIAQFGVRMGMSTNDYLWTLRARNVAYDLTGYESISDFESTYLGYSGFAWILDDPGWGAICFRRPPLTAGDPISGFDAGGTPQFAVHQLSGKVEAENYDYFPDDGEGYTYHDLTPTNTGGAYRSDAVDIATNSVGDTYLTDLEAGEWVTYTVDVPANGSYGIKVRYAGGGGTLRFSFGEQDVTTDVGLPTTGGMTNWSTYAVAADVQLAAGVQAMRIHIGGASDAFVLDSIAVVPMLGYTLKGTAMNFFWPSNQPGWHLETQSNLLEKSWTSIPGSDATNTWTQPLGGIDSAFFRLVSP